MLLGLPFYGQVFLCASVIAAGGAGIAWLFSLCDPDFAVKLRIQDAILLVLYGIGGGICIAGMDGVLLKIQILLLFTILCSEGYVDIQTSTVYIFQTIGLWISQLALCGIRLACGQIDFNAVLENSPQVDTFFHMFAAGPFNSVITCLIFMTIIILMGGIRIIAKGDVVIYGAIALACLSIGKYGDLRFGICIITSYTVFVIAYFSKIVYRKIKYKESILKQRCPFTAPIAFGALMGVFLVGRYL